MLFLKLFLSSLTTVCFSVFDSISQWRTTSDTCPQCRTRYAGREPVKLYFDMQVATDCDASDPAVLQVCIIAHLKTNKSSAYVYSS